MALKDWKKTRPENPDLGEILQWERKSPEGRVWIQKTEKSYWVNGWYGETYNFFNKRYDTEKKAISSAKNYMRTH